MAHTHFSKQHEMEQIRRFLLADKLLHNQHQDFSLELEQLMIQKSKLHPKDILVKGEILMELPFAKMIKYNSHIFYMNMLPPPPTFPPDNGVFLLDPMNSSDHHQFIPFLHEKELFTTILLEDIQPYSLLLFWLILAASDVLILLFFIYIIRKLLPLQHLKNSIIAFKESDLRLDIPVKGNDEISQITREFNTKLEKIASLREARSLFLRNILHELKTPIMKGALTTDCLESSTDKERLKQIFSRMDFLLNEFAKMERFNSGEWQINLQKYRFVDILDHTCDMLLCDKRSLDIKGKESELIVNVDFELFAVALKNLLDNAFKYSREKPTLTISKTSINICSSGEELSKEQQNFKKAFNRDFENSSAGLGIGLYITVSILKKHDFKLEYNYINGVNCFRVILQIPHAELINPSYPIQK